MEDNHKIVRDGYEVMGEKYDQRRKNREQVNIEWLDSLAEHLPASGSVVDIGCGAGVPITRYFATRGYSVVGFDISPRMIELAVTNVPNGKFEVMPMEDVNLEPNSVDLVVSCYAIIHVDRSKHASLLQSIYRWLKPGGCALLILGADDNPYEYCDDWDGAPMMWSHFDAETNLGLLRDAGFEISWNEIDEMPTERFLNVIARKPD